jgi:phenylalanyl-tRNA synthetase beta chain
MEYSLRTFSKSANFQLLTLTELVNNLNLIGFEVDEIDYQNIKSNRFLQDINLLIKIPANRQDLLNEINFQKELATIFLLKLNQIWKKINPDYYFLLNQKYNQYKSYKTYQIESDLTSLSIYSIEIKKLNKRISPMWIQNKLLSNGINPNKNFLDILSLVNLEWGQTIDFSNSKILSDQYLYLDKLVKKEFINNENNEIYELPIGSIVLKNSNKEILSVLGFNYFEFDKSISNESITLHAIFYNIYDDLLKLSRSNNQISLRYLRKTFLENFRFSFQRLLSLLELITDAEIVLKKHLLIEKATTIKPYRILSLDKTNLKKFLNSNNFDLEIFKKASLEISCDTPTTFYIQIPDSRKDLLREIDLIEEYSRFYGYKNFEEILPTKNLVYSKKSPKNITFIKNFFINHNFFEIITSSLNKNENFEINIELLNPLNNELSVLRTQLLPNLIDVFLTNSKVENKSNKFFEIGRVFKKWNGTIIEQEKLAAIFQLNSKNSNLEWFEAKGFLESLLEKFGYNNLTLTKLDIKTTIFHPKRSIIIKSNNQNIGIFGELHPSFRQEFLIKSKIYLFELNLNSLKNWRMNSSIILHSEISKYPSITKDLSFSISKEQNFYDIKERILNTSNLLKTVTFFDIYFDENLLNSVNIGIHLEFQSKKETLTSEEIENEIIKIRTLLIDTFFVEFKN